jgi:DivIVA domain-containing protein
VKRKETPAEGEGFEKSPARLTPLDIQEKTFRTARLSGGYHVREVDEFLDQVTDALSALIAENERLRAAAAKGSNAPASASPATGPTTPAVGPEDRAAVESFLQRERTFLQGLGGLVQEHTEALREMARSARRGPTKEGATERTVAPAPAAEAVETAEETVGSAPRHAAGVEEPVPAAAADVEPESPLEVGGDHVAPSVQEPPDEEPIRLEETRRVRSAPQGEPEPSLRELFWGEE